MSLFHFNIPISTNGLFHNPISTNSSITSSNISRSIPNTQSLHTRITTTSLLSPYPNHCRDPTPALQVCTRTYIPSLGQVQIGLQLCAGNHASSAKFLRSPALSTGQAIGASLLSLARCGGLWDYPRALKAGLLHPTATTPTSWAVPACTRVSSRQSALLTRKFPDRPRTQWKKTPLPAGPPPQTPTRLLLAAHPPRPISYIGSDDILTVLLGGSLPGTNTAGNTEACPGQQWLTGTVEEGNLLSSNQPVAHRMCDFLADLRARLQSHALEAPQEQSITHS
ncbi:hypothetical protein BASA83_013050 [Batrachochytrium salamandrivorans]|nr:hypothetical protein BASA83_013050 [Batrachochytrium salamandrivorans]